MGTCKDCRFNATEKQKKALEATGFDDQIMFDDEDVVVYMCMAPSGPHRGKTIGLAPISCEAFSEPEAQTERLSELDRMIAAREARKQREGDNGR